MREEEDKGRRNDFLDREIRSLTGIYKDFGFCSERRNMVIFEQHSKITLDVKWISQACVWKADAVGTRRDKGRTVAIFQVVNNCAWIE